MFVIAFNKLNNTTSPTRNEAHQDSDPTNASSSPLRNQHNGYHCFLRREDWSRWISVATHLFHWLEKQFSTFAVFRVPNFSGCFEALNDVFWGFRA
jgi:hypothetical protein